MSPEAQFPSCPPGPGRCLSAYLVETFLSALGGTRTRSRTRSPRLHHPQRGPLPLPAAARRPPHTIALGRSARLQPTAFPLVSS